jgi:uncharacterized protein GlcG (DUF336 family)
MTFLESAQRAVEAGLAYAREHDLKMTVVVLDVTGLPVASARMDGARTITWDIGLAKANTALRFQTSTSDLKERVKPENKVAIGQIAPNIAFLGGGLPVVRGGDVVGAVGASGASEEQDSACAEAAVAAI